MGLFFCGIHNVKSLFCIELYQIERDIDEGSLDISSAVKQLRKLMRGQFEGDVVDSVFFESFARLNTLMFLKLNTTKNIIWTLRTTPTKKIASIRKSVI